jgi:hypothetical protein
MSIALVQSITAAYVSGTTITITFPSAPTNGNTVIIVYEHSNFSGTSITATCSAIGGVTPTKRISNVTNRTVELLDAINVSGAGTSATLTLSGTPNVATAAGAMVFEFSGIASYDTAQPNSATALTQTTASLTPTASRSAVIVAGLRSGGPIASGPTNSFTAGPVAGDTRGVSAYQIIASTSGSYLTTWDSGGSNAYATIIGSYLEAVAAGVKLRPYMMGA